MEMGPIYQAMVEAAAVILVALVGWVAIEFKKYVGSKIDNDELKNSILLTGSTIEGSVKSIIQAMNEAGKIAVADGKVKKEELKEIEDKVFMQLTEQVSPQMQARLKAHVLDLQTWTTNKIAAEMQKAEKVTG